VSPGQTVCCFSHTIKGQAHNMPLLAHFLRVGASLVDYEVIVDDAGARQVAFGRYAGLAGAHETLWTLGHRLAHLGHRDALAALRHAVDYPDLAAMVSHTHQALAACAKEPTSALEPFAVAVTGEGRVSRGALEYFDLVGAERVPHAALGARPGGSPLAVVHLTDREVFVRADGAFTLEDFIARPERYLSVGAMYLPAVRALVNGLYWDARFPRLLDASTLRRMYDNRALPVALGDVACDLHGGVEWTVRATENDAPAFVYDPDSGRATVGVEGPGVAIMAVDNLPCALPRDASVDFSRALVPYVRAFFEADFSRGVDMLPTALRRAVVVASGRLGPAHTGLEASLPKDSVER
jgi:alpha-aminoadipic semialdehyde synthase